MRKEAITGIGFIVFSIIMFCLVIFGKIVHDIKETDKNDLWNAAEFYPVEKEQIEIEGLQKYWDKIAYIKTSVGDYATTSFQYRMPFILSKKRVDKLFGLDMTTSLNGGVNDIEDTNDVVLPYSNDSLGWVCDDMNISRHLESLIQFGQEMEAEGRNFLFFENPEKFTETEIYKDYSEKKYAEIQTAFDSNRLNIISAKDLEEAYPNDLSEMFYKTDHHWKPESGLWADTILCSYLNEEFAYQFDTSLFDISNYKMITYDKSMLGSIGKKVTEIYTSAEEFRLCLPVYKLDLEVFISGKNSSYSGSMQDTLFDYSVFDDYDMYNTALYDFYGYGNQGLIKIHNNDITDGSHILLVKASFANCMYPYLAGVVEDLDVIDLREFNGSLNSYIHQTNPDTVIVIYNLRSFKNGNDALFDFR